MTRLPAEWEPQSAVFVAWPHASGDFGAHLEVVEATYARIAKEVSLRQKVLIACENAEHENPIRQRLAAAGADPANVTLLPLPYNDTWVRDTAPLTVITPPGARLVDFRFNGWGGKYFCREDDALAGNLSRTAPFAATPYNRVDFVLEGGSIESDGRDTLLTTRHCLLNPNRNPLLDRAGIEQILRTHLGVRRILWLDHGHLEGDDTDAHVDTLARFCSVDTIAYTACDDRADPHYHELQAMAEQLRRLTMADERPYRLVELPLPAPVRDEQDRRLPANYANFLIINGAVLVPVYGDPKDELALNRLKTCFPDREMIAIPCRPLVQQYGSLHCMSMQFPDAIEMT